MAKKFLNLKIILILIFLIYPNLSHGQNLKKAYFAGGCFWCMEEVFEKIDGVIEVVSGYSGGSKKNPTYKEVVYGNTGHFEVIEINYDNNKVQFEKLLDFFWINIDPFDAKGQFCDKGFSYRSVAFYKSDLEKYQDDEYSATSLFSLPAFQPNNFLFSPSNYVNEGMLNRYNAVNVSFNFYDFYSLYYF